MSIGRSCYFSTVEKTRHYLIKGFFMSKRISYVLNHVFSPDLNSLVSLVKDRGPEFLIGKITVPGGKIEGDDSIKKSATKEMMEETGVFVPEEDWVIFEKYEEEDYILYKLVALSENYKNAKTMETEKVFNVNVEEVALDCNSRPEKYTNDFKFNLIKSIEALEEAGLLNNKVKKRHLFLVK